MNIKEYSFGKIKIDDSVYTKDLVISNSRIYPNWWRKEGHNLYVEDIEEFIEKEKPQVIVIGTGYYGVMKIDNKTIEYLHEKKIRVYIEKTKNAVDIFNELIKRKEKVLGFFHLTC